MAKMTEKDKWYNAGYDDCMANNGWVGLHIGPYHIYWVGKELWIQHEGEGGAFDDDKFLAIVEQFYKEEF